MRVPHATYRVQLHAGFDFAAARAIVPYLARLGVSHLYTSPILQAEAGSTHGYDVVDHSRMSEELGGAAAFDALVATLREHGLGLVVDVVPNHMAISRANAWWWDVLEHGPASPFASYFDVDWEPPESRLRNVILLPVLEDHYGRVLEAGGLRLERDGAAVTVAYADHRFPLDPRTLDELVRDAATRAGSDELAFIGRSLGELPPSTSTGPDAVERRRTDAGVLAERLAVLVDEPPVAAAFDAALAALHADADRLDELLDAQNYRLAFWRASSRDLGYRRFFDIDTLVGLRIEDPAVFEATHRVILDRVAAGDIDGLRIDHPDGLRDPGAYFARLREAAPEAWIVAEKILEPGEPMRDWPVDGTTGYRFANLATGVLVDPDGEGPLTELYARLAEAEPDWEAVAYASRLQALAEGLGSDVNRLTELWLGICEANRRYRDFTRHELHEALRELAAAYPVYRTYVRAADGTATDADRAVVRAAVALAEERRPDLDPDLFDFLAAILLLEVPGPSTGELAMRFQQLTPAGMAKGVEDTAFYRYLRLLALNEVGGDPGTFGIGPEAFAEALAAEQAVAPRGMLALTTHDTKRSADVRARLALLAEVPDAWADAVARLGARAAPHRAGELPGPAAEYLLFQTLVGAWPIDVERALGYVEKATREAKERTSWTSPDPDFDAALAGLVRGCLADAAFEAELEAVVTPLVGPGRTNALAQQLWQLTAPGAPDIYQGGELWDLSLVDPDNRRPVDYERHARLVEELDALDPAAIAAGADDGLPKAHLVRQALALRSRRPESLAAGATFQPLAAEGPAAAHVVAHRRGEDVIAVAPRLVLRLAAGGGWRGSTLPLPDGRWRDVLAGTVHAGAAPLDDLLATFGVALLERVG